MKSLPFVIVFWLGVVALVSLIPYILLPGFTLDAGIRVSKKILAHLISYALVAWLYSKAYGLSINGIAFMLLLASASEVIHYLFTAHRNIEVRDVN